MASQHQAAGGVAVEPMRQDRRSRQSETQRGKGGVQGGAPPPAPMHGKARRPVHFQHPFLAMQDAALDFVRAQLGNFARSLETFAHKRTGNTPGINDTTPKETPSWRGYCRAACINLRFRSLAR